jgi:hypothetical protein
MKTEMGQSRFLEAMVMFCAARRRAWALAVALFLAAAGTAEAASWEAGGLSFSDELGGFRLLAVSGSGTLADPIVLVEELGAPGPAVLTVRNGQAAANSNLGGQQTGRAFLGLVLIKQVTNRSPYRWSGFEMELREELQQPSVYSDGLSFDQLGSIRQNLYSDRFSQAKKANEPYDRLTFDRGRLEPGETAAFFFNIVDLSPGAVFYLVQEPIMLLSEGPAERRDALAEK